MVFLKVTKKFFFFLIFLKSLLSPWRDKTSEEKSIKHYWLIFFLDHNFTKFWQPPWSYLNRRGGVADYAHPILMSPLSFGSHRRACMFKKISWKHRCTKISILLEKEFQPIVWRFSFRKSAFPSPDKLCYLDILLDLLYLSLNFTF